MTAYLYWAGFVAMVAARVAMALVVYKVWKVRKQNG